MVEQNAPESSPPARSPEPVLHRSAGRDLFAQRYVVGWPEHDLVKIGCSSSRTRVRRFLCTEGAELIDLAYYERLCDGVRSECWLSEQACARWASAWQDKVDAQFLLGNNTGGWTEFYAVPVAEWPELKRLAAL